MKKKQRRGEDIAIVIFFIVLLTVCCICGLMQFKGEKTEKKQKSYNAARVEVEEQEKEPSTVYQKRDTDIETENDMTAEQIEEYIKDGSKTEVRNKNAESVIACWNKGLESSIINQTALMEKGYALNRNGIQQIKDSYVKRTGSKNLMVVPYKYIEYAKCIYCIVKILPVITYENGEAGYNYANAIEDTFTIYDDGTFVPYAINHIRGTMIGIHEIEEK